MARHKKSDENPLRLIAGFLILSEQRFLTYLQSNAVISDQVQTIDDVHPDDVLAACIFTGKIDWSWVDPPWRNRTEERKHYHLVQFLEKHRTNTFRVWT